MREITLHVPQGIGDIIWIYQKFAPYFDKIHWTVMTTGTSPQIESRALAFLPLLPKSGTCRLTQVTWPFYLEIINSVPKLRSLIDSEVLGCYYACNWPLEMGIRLEHIDTDMDVQWDCGVRCDPCDLPCDDYVALYVSGASKDVRDVWSLDDWVEFVRRVYDKQGLSCPVVLTGALYDMDSLTPVRNGLENAGIKTHSFVNEYAPFVTHMLSKARLFIGYQSGLNILCDQLDTPQIMMYFNRLPKLPLAWPKRENIRNGNYQYFLFRQSPQEVAEKASLGG